VLSYAQARTRLATLLALGLASTAIAVTAPTAWAADDVAPRLDSITFTSPADVRPGDPVSISYAVTDDSPTVSIEASFLDGAQRRTEWDFGHDLPLTGAASATVPDGLANVTAYLYRVTLTDASGNRSEYGPGLVTCQPDCPTASALQLTHSFTVSGSTPDTVAPLLTSVSLPSSSAPVGQVLRLQVAVDEANPPAGPTDSAAEAVFSNGSQSFQLLADPADRGSLVGVVPATMPNGTYSLSSVVVRDLAGNASTYRRTGAVQVSPAGVTGPTTHTFPFATTTVTVTGSSADYTPPVLTALAYPTPYFVSGTTGTIAYTATEQALASVTVHYGTHYAPTGPTYWDLVATPTSSDRASGPVPPGTAGTWFVESVELTDRAGNRSEYRRDGTLSCNRSCPSTHTVDLAALDRTVITAPSAPYSAYANGLDNSARLQWDSPIDDGFGAITGYTVTVSPGGKTYAVGASTRALTVSGLTNNTAYTLSVRAKNAAGIGPARTVKAIPRALQRLFVTVDVSNDSRADIVGVTRGNVAYIYRGNGAGGISGSTRVGSGLGDLRALLPARAKPNDDFFGGNALAVTYSGKDESWWAYNGNRLTAFNSILPGRFNAYRQIVTPGDFNGNTKADVLTVADNGDMYLWINKDWAHFYAPKKVGSGWQSFTSIVGVGDLDGDRRNDLVARRSDGTLWLYPGNGAGGFRPRKQIGTSWNSFAQIAGMGDFTGDRRNDLLALAPNGYLYVYKGNGKGGFSGRVLVSKGFGSFV
jgi:hypothetical protein